MLILNSLRYGGGLEKIITANSIVKKNPTTTNRFRSNESTIIPVEIDSTPAATTANEDNSRSLPTNVLDEIQAYLSFNVTKRPFPPNTPGAWLHVGKAGGSTLCQVHPTAYHSFVLKYYKKTMPAQRMKFDNYFGATTTYIHTPDFDKLRKQGQYYPEYSFYIANIRDPFSKLVSQFTYAHFKNGLEGMARNVVRHRCKHYFQCFPTLESFATFVGDDPLAFEYPYNPMENFNRTKTNCTDLARASMANKVEYCVSHLYWNTKTILEKVPGWKDWLSLTLLNHSNSSNNKPLHFFAIRTEHMDRDFKKVNELLGDPHPVLLKELGQGKARVQAVNKVEKNVTTVGRRRLCKALLPEYKVYLEALSRSINLSPRDRQKSLELSRTNCPELDWLFRMDFVE
jgi:hypothetical protein